MQDFFEYEVRYCPDSFPNIVAATEAEAVRKARRLVIKNGCEYLLYGINEHGEYYIGVIN